MTRVFNRRKFKPHLSGKLDAKQLKTLADALAKAGVAKLKGSKSSRGANPKVLTVEYGKSKYSHSLSAGVSNPKEVMDKTGRAMLTLSKTIEKLMPWRKKATR